MSVYQIAVTGTTFAGDTSLLNQDTTFTPLENFAFQQATLAVMPAIDTAGTSGTGINVADIGLYVGQPLDGDVRAGELIWASNSAMHLEFAPGASQGQAAAVDEVFQHFDPATNTLITQIDPNTVAITNLDHYIERSGLLGLPREVVAGKVDLTFSPDLTTVHGVATLFGGGFIEPGTFAWSAIFDGTLVG
jgi:hypothetical protein